ncbi:hypothetical protein GUJ93_ZPchr0007g5563 [Zizania palustris]|uniref:Uncharacterized protein n=1 Tax=Zizania palustris TaxID=103762 RepID=A0A8J5W020_ZIZPA|nr:hypothetical protein GUJ93_ZPchr0007g5563 [Zizania palustris]
MEYCIKFWVGILATEKRKIGHTTLSSGRTKKRKGALLRLGFELGRALGEGRRTGGGGEAWWKRRRPARWKGAAATGRGAEDWRAREREERVGDGGPAMPGEVGGSGGPATPGEVGEGGGHWQRGRRNRRRGEGRRAREREERVGDGGPATPSEVGGGGGPATPGEVGGGGGHRQRGRRKTSSREPGRGLSREGEGGTGRKEKKRFGVCSNGNCG